MRRQRPSDTSSRHWRRPRHAGRRGAAKLERVAGAGAARTRSELEARFLELVRSAGLPHPQANANVWAAGVPVEVDFLWPGPKVVVELDSRAFHAGAVAFERDRERDRILQAAGHRVVRVTWRQLHEEPARVLRDLVRLVAVATGTLGRP